MSTYVVGVYFQVAWPNRTFMKQLIAYEKELQDQVQLPSRKVNDDETKSTGPTVVNTGVPHSQETTPPPALQSGPRHSPTVVS